jgi:anti-sigma factor RsiW
VIDMSNNHLSEDQFAECLAGQATIAERKHIAECAECTAELVRFGRTMSVFRNAIRDRIDARAALQSPAIPPFPIRPAAARIPTWGWALAAAAAVVFVMVPLLTNKNEPPQVTPKAPAPMSPDALMNAVNLHLSRTVPAPMERMMTVIPNDESVNQSGGVQ